MSFNKATVHAWLERARRNLPFITPKKVTGLIKNGRAKFWKQANGRYYVRIKDYQDDENRPGALYDLIVIMDGKLKKIITYFENEPKTIKETEGH
jgi:hypothetical protein